MKKILTLLLLPIISNVDSTNLSTTRESYHINSENNDIWKNLNLDANIKTDISMFNKKIDKKTENINLINLDKYNGLDNFLEEYPIIKIKGFCWNTCKNIYGDTGGSEKNMKMSEFKTSNLFKKNNSVKTELNKYETQNAVISDFTNESYMNTNILNNDKESFLTMNAESIISINFGAMSEITSAISRTLLLEITFTK